MKTYSTLDKLCNDVSYASLSWLLTILKRFSDTAFSNREYGPLHPMLSCETDQIYSRADCEKSNDQIYSTPVSNKILWISASFKLWYLVVPQLVLEIFKNKTGPLSNNYPVYFKISLVGPLLDTRNYKSPEMASSVFSFLSVCPQAKRSRFLTQEPNFLKICDIGRENIPLVAESGAEKITIIHRAVID